LTILETVVWMMSLLPLLLALNRSTEWGWRSGKIVSLLAVSLLASVVFVCAELRKTSPLIDIRMFAAESFSIPVSAEFLFYLALYAVGYLVPILVITGRGMPPAWVGMLLATQSLIRTVAAPSGGMLADRLGTRRVLATGSLLFLVAILILVSACSSGSIVTFLVASGLIGLGTGAFVPPNSSRLLSAVTPNRRAIASAVLATARNLGMMFGLAAAAAAYSNSVSALKGPGKILWGIRAGLSIALLATATAVLISWVADDRWAAAKIRKRRAQEAVCTSDSTLRSAI
jgi:MFS family permease